MLTIENGRLDFFVEKSSLGVAEKFLRDGWHSTGTFYPQVIVSYFS